MPKKRTLYLSIAELKQLGLIKKHLKRKRRRYYQKRLVSSSLPSSYNGIKSSSDIQSFGQQINRQNDLENIIKQNMIEKQDREKRKAEVIDLTQDDEYKPFAINRTPTKNGYDFGDNIDVSETKGSDYFPTEGTNTPQVENVYPNNTDTTYLNRLQSNQGITIQSPNTYETEMRDEFNKLKLEYERLSGPKDIRKWKANNRNIASLYNLIDTLEGNISGARKAKSTYQIPKKANAI